MSMKKIVLIFTLLFSFSANANVKECKRHLIESSKAQDELAMYMVNDLQVDAYHAAKVALRHTIKAKVNCKGLKGIDSFDFNKKINSLKGYMDKYNPNK